MYNSPPGWPYTETSTFAPLTGGLHTFESAANQALALLMLTYKRRTRLARSKESDTFQAQRVDQYISC